jgi:ATP-dependent helicase Lhr and Lhr-like helicase
VDETIRMLERARRLVRIPIAGSSRYIAAEDASRYRDAVGVPVPQGLPEALLQPVRDPVGDLVLRYARTHGPFTSDECARRFGLGLAVVEEVLGRLGAIGRLLAGEFRPAGVHREWCETGVLRTLRQRSLARLRHEIEPLESDALGRMAAAWHGVVTPRPGLDALLDAIEQLQGAALPASVLETEVLPARVAGYRPSDLDLLMGAGEVVWIGVEPLGDRDGRLALYLTDHLPTLLPPPATSEHVGCALRILQHLETAGASFFPAIHTTCGGGFPQEVVDALWDLVWAGVVTNDTFHAVRAFLAPPPRTRRDRQARAYRSRRAAPPAAQGRWSLVTSRGDAHRSPTEWATAIARQLLNRHGVLTREAVAAEGLRGGFSTVYQVLKTMEEGGRVRRGLFVGGLGATQFAQPAALDLLRSVRDEPETPQTVHLAATDPANPYGAILRWPTASGPPRDGRGPTRSAGATVILVNGRLAAYLTRGDKQLSVYLPDAEPARTITAHAVAGRLFQLATAQEARRGMLIAQIDAVPVAQHPLAPYLIEAGFVRGAMGFHAHRMAPSASRDGAA